MKAKYNGKLPRSGRDTTFIEWVESIAKQVDKTKIPKSFGVSLRFGSEKIHIADIATKRVKNIIDCLFPIIGGVAGAPYDWKIDCLFVEKVVNDLAEEEIEIVFFGN